MKICKKHKHELKRKARRVACNRGDVKHPVTLITDPHKLAMNKVLVNKVFGVNT